MELENTFKSRIQEYGVKNSFYLAVVDNYTSYTDTISKGVNKKFVQLYFCTRGKVAFHFQGREDIILQADKSLVVFDSKQDTPINLSLQEKSKLVILVADSSWIKKEFKEQSKFLLYNASSLFEQNNLSLEEKMVVSQLDSYNISHNLVEKYIDLKVQELMLFYFSYKSIETNDSKYMKDENMNKKLHQIKNTLLEHIATPPTLRELSLKYKISEYRIKQGFQAVFGKNISTFILDTKMEMAKEKLEKKVKQVKEISYELGYENPSHFIESFKKKYGVTPKKWMMR